MRLMSKSEFLIVPKGTKFTGPGKLGLNDLLKGTRQQAIIGMATCTHYLAQVYGKLKQASTNFYFI